MAKKVEPRRAANGEGSVRFNPARDRYEGRVTTGIGAHGQPLRRMVTGKSEREVRRRMRDLATATEQGLTPASRSLTVGRFLDEWITDVLPGTVEPPTQSQYEGIVKRYLKPMLGRHHLATLTARDVTVMLRTLATPTPERPNGYSSTTLRLCRTVLRRALRYAEQEGLVARNVAAIANPPKAVHHEGRTMTPQEARTFLESVEGHRQQAAFVVALLCGLSVSELLGLGWDAVNLEGSVPTLKVRRGLKFVPGVGLILSGTKNSKRMRTVHLPELARTALVEHRKVQRAERLAATVWPAKPLGADLVFRATNGEALDPSNFRKELSKATQAAGLGHWHPHELRHSTASLLFAQGVPLKVVSETLGHSSITITADIYSHLLDDSRAEAADAMTRALAGA
jgi:integrase